MKPNTVPDGTTWATATSLMRVPMSGTLRILLAAIAMFALTNAGSAAPAPPAGTNVSLPFPAKSPLVLQINGFERVKERLTKMLEALPPAEAKQVQKQIETGLGHVLKDRKLDAIPKEGRVFVVLHDFTKLVEGEPAVSVLLPVSSYKEFKGTLLTAEERKSIEKAGNGMESMKSLATGDEQTLYLVDLKAYVALTPSKETAEVYAGKYTSAQSGSMGTDLAGSFLNADVSLFVNMDAINDLHGEQIRQFKGLIDFALGQAQNMGMVPGLGKKELEMVKTMIGGLFQGIEDSKGIVLGLEFRPEGLSVRAQIRFAEDTMSADIFKAEVPSALADLTKLPKGLSTYAGSKFGKKFTDLGKKFAQEFSVTDDDEKGLAQLEKLLAEVTAAGPQGDYSASNAPESTITVTAYKSAEKAATALVKIYEGMPAGGKFSGIVLKSKPKVKNEAATVGDFKFTEVNVAFDFAASVEALPEAAREAAMGQYKRLMKEKSTFWLGTDGKVVVQLTAKDWDAARKLLEDYLSGKGGVGTDAGFQLARKNLPPEASLLYLLETGQLVTLLVEQAKAVGQAIPGGAFPAIGSVKPVKGDATYIGIALTLKAQTATFDLFVPGTSMNVMSKMIAPLLRNVE